MDGTTRSELDAFAFDLARIVRDLQRRSVPDEDIVATLEAQIRDVAPIPKPATWSLLPWRSREGQELYIEDAEGDEVCCEQAFESFEDVAFVLALVNRPCGKSPPREAT
jgi:hypothetical protein